MQRELADNLGFPWGRNYEPRRPRPLCASQRYSKDARYINAIDSVVPNWLCVDASGKGVGVLDIQSRHLDYFTRDQPEYFDAAGQRWQCD